MPQKDGLARGFGDAYKDQSAARDGSATDLWCQADEYNWQHVIHLESAGECTHGAFGNLSGGATGCCFILIGI